MSATNLCYAIYIIYLLIDIFLQRNITKKEMQKIKNEVKGTANNGLTKSGVIPILNTTVIIKS